MTKTTKLGVAALVFYVPHASWHVTHGAAWDLLWMCNVAMPILVIGAFAQNPRAVVTAFLFLIYGTPMWLLDVLAGGHMVITSPLVHVGGLTVAYLAVRTLGWPRYSWVVASLASAFVLGLSRLLSPSDANVNMAFRVYEGWEKYFSSHATYVSGLWLVAAAVFGFVEWGAMRMHLRTEQP